MIVGKKEKPYTRNRYSYCFNTPTVLVDLNGKQPQTSENFFVEGTTIQPLDPNLKYYDEDPDTKKGTFSIGASIDGTCFLEL